MKTPTPKDAGQRFGRLIGLDCDETVTEYGRPVVAAMGGSRRLKTTEGVRDTPSLSHGTAKEALSA